MRVAERVAVVVVARGATTFAPVRETTLPPVAVRDCVVAFSRADTGDVALRDCVVVGAVVPVVTARFATFAVSRVDWVFVVVEFAVGFWRDCVADAAVVGAPRRAAARTASPSLSARAPKTQVTARHTAKISLIPFILIGKV